MNNIFTIEEAGKLYIFKNIDGENRKHFITRCQFIVRNIQVCNIIELSKLWVSVKYLGVEYSKEIMNILTSLNGPYTISQ